MKVYLIKKRNTSSYFLRKENGLEVFVESPILARWFKSFERAERYLLKHLFSKLTIFPLYEIQEFECRCI